jgi:hypothetical protein
MLRFGVLRQVWSASAPLPDEVVTAIDTIERALNAAVQGRPQHDGEQGTQTTTSSELMGHCQDGCDTTQTSALIWRLACSEMVVACKALRNEQAWEYAKQRAAALRFAEFVLHSMLRYLTRYGTGCNTAPDGIHPLQLADASIHCERLSSHHPFARRIAQCAALVNEHLAREGNKLNYNRTVLAEICS